LVDDFFGTGQQLQFQENILGVHTSEGLIQQ
jgi:hypothetical protein